MNNFSLVFREHMSNVKGIWSMALNDLKKQYSGTMLSYFWVVLKNLIFIGAYWFAISIGLKGSANVGYPYIAWLVSGLGGWFIIRDALLPAASSIRKNKYLVTKMVYPISIIPTFKVISSFVSNLMFLPVIFIILVLSGVEFDLHWFQIVYYQFAAVMLLIGLAWTTSALVVVSRDIEMLIGSSVFMIFWLTPILFPIGNMAPTLAFVLKLNPFFYIVEGFRGSLLYGEWFWNSPLLTMYFWVVVVSLMVLGSFVHSRLRNQFVDIL